ncbi:MAG TPA: DnaA/Hda family protein, partial [Longimicrobiaceae bacterium]|nr:DnaA/Hda family protein [Longimicrobiaceae bacterium]
MTSTLDPRFTFDSFVVGPSNRLAAAAARRAAESPGTSYNPLVIHSGPGLGKTHLLNAVGHLALSVRPELRVEYETLGRLVDRVNAALAAGAIEAFREECRSVDLLLLDDIQFLAGKVRSQEELLRVWDEMVRAGAQVVLASDRAPQEIDGLDARLVSRLSGGLIVDLAPPEVETRIAILRRKAEERGVVLGPAVTDALARLTWSSVRELQGGLNRLLALQETEAREVAPEEVAPFLGMQPGGAAPEDEFSTFLLDISSTVAQMVESAPWRRALGEAILRWEGEGVRTRRLEEALESESVPDVEALLAGFAADVERLRVAEAGVRALDPEAASSPLFHDPDRVEDAEALLTAARAAAVPLAAPPAGKTLEEVAGRLGDESLAVRAARRALGRPVAGNNPLFVHAPRGRDATELLGAIGRAALAERPGARVAYVRAATLPEEMAAALRA